MVRIILIVGMLILILAMVKMIIPKVILPSLKRYFCGNLGAPFVIGFQVLLLVCEGLLIQGDPGLANEVAVYAYYLLVVGVVLQFFQILKAERWSPNAKRK